MRHARVTLFLLAGGSAGLVGCQLVADLVGYEVLADGAGGAGLGGRGGAAGEGGHGGGAGGGGAGAAGGAPTLPCGSMCTGAHQWTQHFAGTGDEWITAVAVDPVTDDVFVGGELLTDLTIGPETHVSSDSERNFFVARLDESGNVLWSFATTSLDDEHLGGLALDADGGVMGVGHFEGGLGLGGKIVDAGSSFDLLVFKVLPDETFAWVETFGGTNHVRGHGIAAHPSGGAVIGGELSGTLDLGGGPLPIIGGGDAFVAHFDAAGGHVWSQSLGGAGNDAVLEVAAAPGGFVVLGRTTAAVDLGGGMLPHAGDVDIFVAKFNAFGVHQWSHAFGGAGTDEARGLCVDAEGRVFVAGEFRETLSLGGELLSSQGDADAFVLVLDADGGHLFSASFGDDAYQSARAVGDDTFDNVLLGGTFGGAISFGGELLTSGGDDRDVFIAKLAVDGTHRFSRAVGNPGPTDQVVERIAHDGSGAGILAGTFEGTVNFGGGPRNALSGRDIFVVKLAP